MCASMLSVVSSTAAIPPCAQALALSVRLRLVTSATRFLSASRKLVGKPQCHRLTGGTAAEDENVELF